MYNSLGATHGLSGDNGGVLNITNCVCIPLVSGHFGGAPSVLQGCSGVQVELDLAVWCAVEQDGPDRESCYLTLGTLSFHP